MFHQRPILGAGVRSAVQPPPPHAAGRAPYKSKKGCPFALSLLSHSPKALFHRVWAAAVVVCSEWGGVAGALNRLEADQNCWVVGALCTHAPSHGPNWLHYHCKNLNVGSFLVGEWGSQTQPKGPQMVDSTAHAIDSSEKAQRRLFAKPTVKLSKLRHDDVTSTNITSITTLTSECVDLVCKGADTPCWTGTRAHVNKTHTKRVWERTVP